MAMTHFVRPLTFLILCSCSLSSSGDPIAIDSTKDIIEHLRPPRQILGGLGKVVGGVLADTQTRLDQLQSQMKRRFESEVTRIFGKTTVNKYRSETMRLATGLANPLTETTRRTLKDVVQRAIPRPRRFFPEGDSPLEINDQRAIADDLYQGDVILTDDQVDYIVSKSSRSKRQAYTLYRPQSLWPTTVSYELDSGLSPTARSAIAKAINFWQNHTCLRFQERPQSVDRIYFFAGAGCYAGVGKPLAGGIQGVSIGYGCEHVPVVSHELAHALGFFHTQNRQDRDGSTIVNYDNIAQQYYPNYVRLEPEENNNYGLPYDYGSGLHYDQYGFAVNWSIPTVVPLDGRYQNSMGQTMPSFIDVSMMNTFYSCNNRCGSTSNCQNAGFPDPNNCARCICPGGFGGTYCDTVVPFYNPYYSAASDHSTVTTGSGMTTSSLSLSGIPVSIESDYKYRNMRIVAPAGRRVEITVVSFQGGSLCAVSCSYGGLEVKTKSDLRLSGIRVCCSEDVGKVLLSDANRLSVTLYSRYGDYGITFRHRYGNIYCVHKAILIVSTHKVSTFVQLVFIHILFMLLS